MTGLWWWLSFADPERPPGQHFLGVAIVDAPDFGHAVIRAHELGCNPGGQVAGWEIPAERVPPAELRGRLLTRADLGALHMFGGTLGDLEDQLEQEDGPSDAGG